MIEIYRKMEYAFSKGSLEHRDDYTVSRVAMIGFTEKIIPKNCLKIDVGLIYSGKPLYPEIIVYCNVTPYPTLFITDSRVLTGDSVKQIIHCLRRFPQLSVKLYADRIQDVPRIFRYFLKPIYSESAENTKSLGKVVIESSPGDVYLVESLAELCDLGFITPEIQKTYLLSLLN